MGRLKTLPPRIPVMGSLVEEKIKRMKANPTGRTADPRRAIPLNSTTWRKLRASVLEREPLCRHCAARGITEPATDVDHRSGDPSDNSPQNLCPLCHSCHSIKTARDHGKNVAMGCDLNGIPLDPQPSLERRAAGRYASPGRIETAEITRR
ncbi:HNH endonuclease signature motif containing protein [Castellaniella sp.]|uniref:HNH endonuclease n=1 Tax=Castellaniella sp. TaxID=1955812 RepID=UPI002AFDCD18|nr:HNH endonuclease signature motif containing protein [Castellaniella sp.]